MTTSMQKRHRWTISVVTGRAVAAIMPGYLCGFKIKTL